MKSKTMMSLLGSVFFLPAAKAQQSTTTIKKETTQQTKTPPKVVAIDKGKKDFSKGTPDVFNKGQSVNKAEKNVVFMQPKWQPGDVIYSSNFNAGNLGDMPKGWKTNGMGSLKTIDGRPGKWLNLNESTLYETDFIDTLPENYNVEFDVITNYKDDQRVPQLTARVYKKGQEFSEAGISLFIEPNGGSVSSPNRFGITTFSAGGGEKVRATNRDLTVLSQKNNSNEPMHVSIMVRGQQLRVSLDGERIYDLEEAVPTNVKLNRIAFKVDDYGGAKDNYKYYLANLQVTAQ